MRISDWSSDVCSSDLVLVLFFHFFPIIGPDGENSLGLRVLLSGFAHPALIAVLGLLVLGEGLARTGVLDDAATSVIRFTRQNRSEEHTSELQSLMRISYAVFCLKQKNKRHRP